MTCCLNPECQQPQNPDDAEYCLSCGVKLVPMLRGRYRVVRPIGQGGFGKTYLALDEDRLKSRCVIKQFSPQLQGVKSLEKAISLFAQEAERLHELGEHPQIPTLLAYFEDNNRFYLVQQFIEGSTLLQELLHQGAFDEQKIREVLVGLLPLLKFIHDRKVIHRDITPSNIIRRKADKKLVLIDFGVAKLVTASASSQAGTKIGTEGYAPMEQLRSGKAFPASDLYSLAATCIFLMTQVKPDDLYDPLEGQWLWRDRLAQRGGRLSEPIAEILDKMLKDLVSDRYQTAGDVMRDLRAALVRPISSSIAKRLSQQPPANPTSRSITAHPPLSSPPASNPTQHSTPNISGNPIPNSLPGISGQRMSKPPTVSGSQNSGPQVSGASNSGQRHSGQSGSGASRCLHILTGHSSWVTAVAFSPDGQTIASGGLDDKIRLWSSTNGTLLHTLTEHTKPINSLAISPNGQWLASASDDHSIRIWHLATGKLQRVLLGHSRDVTAVAFHPNGQWLASGSEDRTARLWQWETGELLRIFPNLAGMIRAVAFSPDGQTLASGGLDNQVKLWSLTTGEQSRSLTGRHFNSINAIAISSDGQCLASASKDKTIKIWQLQTGGLLRTLTGHSDSVNAIAITPNGRWLVSGSSDKTIRIWDLASGDLRFTLSDHTNPVNSLALSHDGHRLISGASDNTVRIWKLI